MDKKGQIYQFIRSEISLKGLPPTIREIGRRFDISSTNGVRYFLSKLEAEGLIERRNWTARGIKVARVRHDDTSQEMYLRIGPGRVTDTPTNVRSVPILGRVPAGKPVVSEENIEGTILLDEKLARGFEVFAVKVRGDSMIGAGINDGDIAVVKQNLAPMPGDIVVALLDDEVTLKRLIKRDKSLVLKPENDQYPEINLSELSHKEIRMLGTVISIVRQY
ncbi:MAG TPA: transcriptional repressor LexA [bacterium]|nr:transcriptional repressor LexA [bacterium]